MKLKKWYILMSLIAVVMATFTLLIKQSSGEAKKEIGIIQIAEHDCLDEARKGFVDGLSEQGYKDGDNIKIDYQNAQGDQSICNSIASNFVQARDSLILAISTPAAQAVSNATDEIPILLTAVTDPKSCGLDAKNITGTSDMVPVEKQIGLIRRLLPKTKKIGILYCSGEINSKYQAQAASAEAKKLGMSAEDYTVSNSNELSQVAEYAAKSADVIFVPTDNMVVSCMPMVSKIATENKVPIICSEVASVKNGALATYGMDYYKLGKMTAEQAVKILKDGEKPENIPIEHLENVKLTVNQDTAQKLGIEIPDEMRGELE